LGVHQGRPKVWRDAEQAEGLEEACGFL